MEWEPIEIAELDDEEFNHPLPNTSISGLESRPKDLHSDFSQSAGHLNEVRDMHTRFLFTAGEIPEKQLAEIDPSRRLSWAVEQLNGISEDEGFRIPLRGASLGEISISQGEFSGHPAVKLSIGNELQRIFPLPNGINNVHAGWRSGWLEIDFIE